MDLSEDWKSLFPISAIFRSPLLLFGPSTRPILGPLVFNQTPNTITHLLPPLLFCHLCLLFPISISLASYLPLPLTPLYSLLLPLVLPPFLVTSLPGTNNIIIFFPTGENSDQVGFLLFSWKNSNLNVRIGDIFVVSCKFNYLVLRILVNLIVDSSFELSNLGGNSSCAIGYLMACTMYSVNWFVIKVKRQGSKVFKTCFAVHACWSPHLPEESIVLLDDGALFLFDLEPCLKPNNFNAHLKGKRLGVPWDDSNDTTDNKWLNCEFSWHPRILVVACSDAVFIVDLRLDQCNVSCLVKIEMLHMYASHENEQFLTLTKVGTDGFQFALAPDSLLLLCDVRKPLMPILQWTHDLSKPCYINVLRLADLRPNSRDENYTWASKSGFGIIVGSLWNCELNLFCYGPSTPALSGSVASRGSNFCKSFYAWELPSNLLLSGHECSCGNCLVKEEFLKDSLPEWATWQQKKEVILGFGIVSNGLFRMLSERDEFGGFTLVRLISSGKLELQRYYASWDSIKELEEPYRNFTEFEDYLMSYIVDEEYKFARSFKYIELDYLCNYLNGNLGEFLDSKIKNPFIGPEAKESFNSKFHETLCKKLNDCGLNRLRLSPVVIIVLNDTSLPSSIREVALWKSWANLPIECLQIAFSNYPEILEVLMDCKKATLEFFIVPDLHQLPPFFLRFPSSCSNKWPRQRKRKATEAASSSEVPSSKPCSRKKMKQKKGPLTDANSLVGPVLHLPILLMLHEFRNGGFSLEEELRVYCDKIIRITNEMASSDFTSELLDDHTWTGSLHRPIAFKCTPTDHAEGSPVYEEEVFGTLISKVPEDHGDDDASTRKELKAYKLLKKQFSKWQGDFNLLYIYIYNCVTLAN
ncbi:hypothetical protein UlMin_023800 [Ulmus minor]